MQGKPGQSTTRRGDSFNGSNKTETEIMGRDWVALSLPSQKQSVKKKDVHLSS
jgi:hypothetical protein